MGSLISKFTLYELFRILLPGSYLTFLFFELFRSYFHSFSLYWPEITLLAFLSSLIFGIIIYSLDLCRYFKCHIKNLPTNLMESNYPQFYPKNEPDKNEHKYYEWYENAEINSKVKTELQSGLYHLSINIAFVSTIGFLVGLVILSQTNNWFYIIFNFALSIFSLLSAFSIVKKRLSRQWLRNFWEFEEKIILPQLNNLNREEK